MKYLQYHYFLYFLIIAFIYPVVIAIINLNYFRIGVYTLIELCLIIVAILDYRLRKAGE